MRSAQHSFSIPQTSLRGLFVYVSLLEHFKHSMQLSHREGLGEEMVHAGLQGAVLAVRVRVRRHADYRQCVLIECARLPVRAGGSELVSD